MNNSLMTALTGSVVSRSRAAVVDCATGQHQFIPPFPPLELVSKPTLTTAELAYYFDRRPQTLRGWACHKDGPLKPRRINGVLAWPTDRAKALLGANSHDMKAAKVLSPWLDPQYNNLYRRAIQLAAENSGRPGFKPDPLYNWIYKHGAEEHLYKALAEFAPLFPVLAYQGEVCSWVSPPPSGYGNVICLVIGRDKSDAVRIVGGNWFGDPHPQARQHQSAVDFFQRYDTSSDRDRQELIRQVTGVGLTTGWGKTAEELRRYCEFFHAMPIYITLLEAGGNQFACGPAVVEGLTSADFAYEVFGEVAP